MGPGFLKPVKIFGHEFRPMNNFDWMEFAGAEVGTLIHRGEYMVLLYDPNSKEVSEFYMNPGDDYLNRVRVWELSMEQDC